MVSASATLLSAALCCRSYGDYSAQRTVGGAKSRNSATSRCVIQACVAGRPQFGLLAVSASAPWAARCCCGKCLLCNRAFHPYLNTVCFENLADCRYVDLPSGLLGVSSSVLALLVTAS